MQKLFFPINTITQFKSLEPFLEHLANNYKQFIIIVDFRELVDENGISISTERNKCIKLGIICFTKQTEILLKDPEHISIPESIPVEETHLQNNTDISKNPLKKFLTLIGLKPLLVKIYNFCYYLPSKIAKLFFGKALFHHIDKLHIAKTVLQENQIDIIVLAEDNIGYTSIYFTKVAQKLKIPVVIMPFTICTKQEILYSIVANPTLFEQLKIKTWQQRIISLLLPKWVAITQSIKLLRLPVKEILFFECLGIATPLPWQVNSSHADYLIAESNFMKDYFLEEGVTKPQIKVLGAIHQDIFYQKKHQKETLRQELYLQLGINNEKPMILCSLVPDYYENKDFKTLEEIHCFFSKTLTNTSNYNIIISKHPRTRYEDIKYLEQYGLKIVALPVTDLIPLCDIFVACVSATIRMALACEKLVLNYDIYNMNYKDYKKAMTVINVNTKQDFELEYKRLTTELEYSMKLQENYQLQKGYYSTLDDLNSERIIHFLETL